MAASYHFQAVAPDGKVRAGVLHGATEKAVARELSSQGLIPVYVGLAPKKSFQLKLPTFTRGKRRDVMFFTQELSTLLNAGVPIDRALSITGELTEHASFGLVVHDVLRILKGGRSLADSLASHPEYFSKLYINIVRAGEASGALGPVFTRLTEFERTRDDLRGYIISAMIYPALLMFVGCASITILMYFVVPRFAQMFQDSRMKMPLPTQIMIETSALVKSYGWMVLLAVVAASAGLYSYVRTVAGRLWWDSIRLKVPVLGDALRKAETSRFARAMETLVTNSVPLVQSLGIASAILNNTRIARSLESVAQGVKRGEGVAGPLRRTGEFPALASHLLSVGEETGRLDQMFARMADIYEADTRAAIRRFTALFEPMIILVMGIFVGALILSILLAITSINEVAV
jgi:general secretion pathway protein F